VRNHLVECSRLQLCSANRLGEST